MNGVLDREVNQALVRDLAFRGSCFQSLFLSGGEENKGLPSWYSGKESACQRRRHKRRGFDPGVRKIPWRMKRQPTPVFLSGKCYGQRSLVGYSPCGHKE